MDVNTWLIGKDEQWKISLHIEESGYRVLFIENDTGFHVLGIDEAKQLHALLGKILSEG